MKKKIFISSERLEEFPWNFQEYITYDNTESEKENRVSPSLWKKSFRKNHRREGRRSQIDPCPCLFSVNKGRYAFLIRLDLLFSMSLWKEFQLLQISNELYIKHLIKLILYENDVKLLTFKRSLYRSISYMFEVWDFEYWCLKWMHQRKQWNV